MLVYASLGDLNPLAVVLAAAALVFVLIRLTLTFRQNVGMLRASRDEALTDALTGLGNRRALTRALDEALPDGHRTCSRSSTSTASSTTTTPSATRPATSCSRGSAPAWSASSTAAAGRSGWAATSSACCSGGDDADTLVEGAARSLSAEGEGYWVGCSYGFIRLPDEAADSDSAMRIADQRMYASKNAGRMSAARQAHDVLLAVLGSARSRPGRAG